MSYTQEIEYVRISYVSVEFVLAFCKFYKTRRRIENSESPFSTRAFFTILKMQGNVELNVKRKDSAPEWCARTRVQRGLSTRWKGLYAVFDKF